MPFKGMKVIEYDRKFIFNNIYNYIKQEDFFGDESIKEYNDDENEECIKKIMEIKNMDNFYGVLYQCGLLDIYLNNDRGKRVLKDSKIKILKSCEEYARKLYSKCSILNYNYFLFESFPEIKERGAQLFCYVYFDYEKSSFTKDFYNLNNFNIDYSLPPEIKYLYEYESLIIPKYNLLYELLNNIVYIRLGFETYGEILLKNMSSEMNSHFKTKARNFDDYFIQMKFYNFKIDQAECIFKFC